MFTENTVLILGAGASVHYNYPTGEGLIDKIISQAITAANENRYSKELAEKLKFYDPLSIDSFLNYWSPNTEFAKRGKYHIARTLLACENDNYFERNFAGAMQKDCQGNWYKFLVNALISSANPISNLINLPLNLSIITFNYDLSLEYYLYSRLKEIPNLTTEQNLEFLKRIDNSIIHVYGQLGKFKWQGGARENNDYGFFNKPFTIRHHGRNESDIKKEMLNQRALDLADNLFLMGERNNIQINHIHEKIDHVDKIYFLGFGFNDDNVRLLGLDRKCTSANEIYYTNFNNSKLINNLIKNHLFAGYKSRSGHIECPRSDNGMHGKLVSSDKTVYSALKFDFSLI